MKAKALIDAWQRRPSREKLLLSVVAAAVVLAGVDLLWTAPLEKRIKRARAETASLQTKIKAIEATSAGAGASPEALREQEASLRQRLERAKAASSQLRARVAEASRLPETLRAITTTVGSARLLELNLASDAQPPSAAASGAAQTLYRLPIALKVSGSYDELQLLLSQIERHADALQWQSVSLDSSAWPAIEMTLKAHVLSLNPRWGST